MRKKRLSILVLFILMASTLVGCSPGQVTPPKLTILSAATGNVSVMKKGTDSWTGAQVGMSLVPGDSVKTGDNSSAKITFFEGSTIELQSDTQIQIVALARSDTGSTTITLDQAIGNTISRVTKLLDPGSSYEVGTPTGVAAARDSVMQVYVIQDGTTWITNLEGNIWAVAQGVELEIPQGQQCIIAPNQPPELVMVAAGAGNTLGLKSDGTVVAVGYNGYGECNVSGWTNITQVAVGYYYTVGLKSDGTVVALGYNVDGQCNVSGWTGTIQVAPGEYHTVGLKSDHTVVAVGANSAGQCNVSGWTGIVQVSAAQWHTVGLKSDHTVVAVGANDYGQCNVSGWTNITQVYAGQDYTVGLKANHTVVAVGYNVDGQCNVSGWTNIVQVSAGYGHTVGLKSDGTVVAVGWNPYGQCNVSGWMGIVQVAAGGGFTVGLCSNGTVVAVGYNGSGECNVTGWQLY